MTEDKQAKMQFLAGDISSFNQMDTMIKLEKQKQEKYKKFIERITEFEKVSTLEEAKELAQKILPVANEKNIFRVGDARCVVVNNDEQFRICVDSAEEFIAYDFVK